MGERPPLNPYMVKKLKSLLSLLCRALNFYFIVEKILHAHHQQQHKISFFFRVNHFSFFLLSRGAQSFF